MFIAHAGAHAPAPDAGQAQARTRDRVLREISEHGPVTAADLASTLGLTPAAVRRHLDSLREHDLVDERDHPVSAARKRGRPARAYVLSDAGHASLDAGYDELATSVLDYLARTGGTDAVREFAQERADAMGTRVRPVVEAVGPDPEARVDALAVALRGEGFAASTRSMGDGTDGTSRAGIQLCQGHCPVQHVARSYPQFCEAEAAVFSDLLGVHVQRLASLAYGDHVCTTFVPAANPTSHAISYKPSPERN